jgi:hypothetical protein
MFAFGQRLPARGAGHQKASFGRRGMLRNFEHATVEHARRDPFTDRA